MRRIALIGCCAEKASSVRPLPARELYRSQLFRKSLAWVEQQGRSHDELVAQWYQPDYWTAMQAQVAEIDALIEAFNQRTGLAR